MNTYYIYINIYIYIYIYKCGRNVREVCWEFRLPMLIYWSRHLVFLKHLNSYGAVV